MASTKVVILYNQPLGNPAPDETHPLHQVRIVSKALTKLRYSPVLLPFSLNVEKAVCALKQISPVFVFNLVESVNDDGQLLCLAPAVLDHLRIPYTGCSKESLFLTSNKLIAKKIMASCGISTPDWITADGTHTHTFAENERYIIKAVWEHASIGLNDDSVVRPRSRGTLTRIIRTEARRLGLEMFAERYIHGRDFSVPILAGKLLPPREMLFLGHPKDRVRVLGYNAKWESHSAEYNETEITFEFSKADHKLLGRLRKISHMCWKEFNLKGYARIDFRTDETDIPYVLEINSNPYIGSDSVFCSALKRVKISYTDAIKQIIGDMNCIYS
jgi:D-alanine-D-alanine ligase